MLARADWLPMPDDYRYDMHTEAGVLAERLFGSRPGSEAEAAAWVGARVAGLDLPTSDLERLQSAVVEAAHNAARIQADPRGEWSLRLRIGASTAASGPGDNPARGWGFFLVERLAAADNTGQPGTLCLIEVVLYPGGDSA